ncbi:MAG: hypothetical protein A3I78_08135 [Gammaproteobacteria bacterium RIFCSPLOWO2_02_FULL_56_15]|nr:MAG: hypothetical protein A3I78_08135 [Gammaproteobacteria bacterium RIFCSPLOWO2_02_FULL_56_15]
MQEYPINRHFKTQQDDRMDDNMNPMRIHSIIRFACRLLLGFQSVFLRSRIRTPCLERVRGRYFLVIPEVLNPVVFRSGQYFAEVLADTSLPGPLPEHRESVALDMGTGCGICAVFAAELGYRVVGVDINPFAVRCARINILLNQLEDRIEIKHGDLFGPVSGQSFDLVLFNPPFYRGAPGSNFELAWKSLDVFERFAGGLEGILNQNGRALILLSTDGDADAMLQALGRNGLTVTLAKQKHFGNEIMTIYEIRRPEFQYQ